MKNPNAYALLIGVGDYRAFDPSGQSDLKGPPHDVAGWLDVVYGLGIPRAHIRVCVSPALPGRAAPGLLDGVDVRGATRADIVEGLTWLAAALDGVAGTKAVLTWSGHGTGTDAGLVLCPSDITADGQTLRNGLTVAEVGRLLDTRAPATRITAFVDTCHTATGFEDSLGTARGRALSWAGACAADAGPMAHRVFGDLVVTSSQPGAVSYEMPVLGGVRGAFSWAASNVIRRYGLADGVSGQTSGLTFTALAETCGRILDGMVVHQKPRFVGDLEAGHARVFSAYGDDEGSTAPTSLQAHEIWPGIPDGDVIGRYKLYAGNSDLGDLYVTGSTPPTGWQPNAQYWYWKSGSWPSKGFTANYKGAYSTTHGAKGVGYKTGLLTPGDGKHVTLHGDSDPLYAVERDGTTLGYLQVSPSELRVVSQTTGIQTLAGDYRDTLQFESRSKVEVNQNSVARDEALK